MTDARFPERWLNDRRLARLSDGGFRLFVTSLVWAVANRTVGKLYDDDVRAAVRLVPAADAALVQELATAGLWRRERDYWLIVDYADTQTSLAELDAAEKARRVWRENKARQRAAKKAMSPGTSTETSPGTSTQDNTGQARTGQDRHLGVPDSPPVADDEPWPPVALPPNDQWARDLYDKER